MFHNQEYFLNFHQSWGYTKSCASGAQFRFVRARVNGRDQTLGGVGVDGAGGVIEIGNGIGHEIEVPVVKLQSHLGDAS